MPRTPDEPPPNERPSGERPTSQHLTKAATFAVGTNSKTLNQLSSSGKAAKDKRQRLQEGKAPADPSDPGKGGSQEDIKEQKK